MDKFNELLRELDKKMDALAINISEDEDGRLTAYSSSEPLFCLVRNTKDDLEEVVRELLASYAKTFYHMDTARFEIQWSDVPEIPVVYLVPRSKLRLRVAS
jgi:hypothetical protein